MLSSSSRAARPPAGKWPWTEPRRGSCRPCSLTTAARSSACATSTATPPLSARSSELLPERAGQERAPLDHRPDRYARLCRRKPEAARTAGEQQSPPGRRPWRASRSRSVCRDVRCDTSTSLRRRSARTRRAGRPGKGDRASVGRACAHRSARRVSGKLLGRLPDPFHWLQLRSAPGPKATRRRRSRGSTRSGAGTPGAGWPGSRPARSARTAAISWAGNSSAAVPSPCHVTQLLEGVHAHRLRSCNRR